MKIKNKRRTKMFEEKNSSMSFITGLITGSVIGGLAALLYAPKSGREFRQDISDKKGELMDDAELMYMNAKEKGSQILSDAKHKAESLLHEGKDKVDSLTGKTGDLVTEGKDKLNEGADKVKNALNSGVNAYNDEKNKLNKDDKNKSNYDDRNKPNKPNY